MRLEEYANMGMVGLYPSFSCDAINALGGVCKYSCIEKRPGRIIILSLTEERPDGIEDSGYGALSQGVWDVWPSIFLHIKKFRSSFARFMGAVYSLLLSKVSCRVGGFLIPFVGLKLIFIVDRYDFRNSD